MLLLNLRKTGCTKSLGGPVGHASMADGGFSWDNTKIRKLQTAQVADYIISRDLAIFCGGKWRPDVDSIKCLILKCWRPEKCQLLFWV